MAFFHNQKPIKTPWTNNTEYQGRRSNGSVVRGQTDGQTDGHYQVHYLPGHSLA